MIKNINELKKLYSMAKGAKINTMIQCPSCGAKFVKTYYNTTFCKRIGNTVCKDHYWNNIDPNKRDNRTRISPASSAWLSQNNIWRYEEHPFSTED